MPMCGFDEQMLEGLGKFYKGLAEAVKKKSKESNITVEEAIKWELKEMNEFLKELIILNNEINKQKLTSIANHSTAFYLGALKYAKEKKITIEEAMKHEVNKTKDFLFDIDNHYYQYLEGKKDSMKQLVSWIGEK